MTEARRGVRVRWRRSRCRLPSIRATLSLHRTRQTSNVHRPMELLEKRTQFAPPDHPPLRRDLASLCRFLSTSDAGTPRSAAPAPDPRPETVARSRAPRARSGLGRSSQVTLPQRPRRLAVRVALVPLFEGLPVVATERITVVNGWP